jgi:hypothetical protein
MSSWKVSSEGTVSNYLGYSLMPQRHCRVIDFTKWNYVYAYISNNPPVSNIILYRIFPDWFSHDQNNMPEWGNISISGLVFHEPISEENKIRHVGLVKCINIMTACLFNYCNLLWPWYIAATTRLEQQINNNTPQHIHTTFKEKEWKRSTGVTYITNM